METKNMSPTKAMENKLKTLEIPYREIKCYGSQITVECLSYAACQKFAEVIKNFAKIRGIREMYSYTKTNKKRRVNPPVMKVFLLYAMI